MKPRYLVFADAQSPHTAKWVKALISEYDVHLISITNGSPAIKELLPPERTVFLHGHGVSHARRLSMVRSLPRILAEARAFQPQFVHGHYLTSYGVMAALVKRTVSREAALIQSAWGSDILVTPQRNRILRGLTRFTLREADLITSDSYNMSDAIFILAEKRALTFPLGLESLPTSEETRNKQPFSFFSNRTLIRNSNVDLIIRAFASWRSVWPQATLVIANDGPERALLQKLTEDLGVAQQVTFVGFTRGQDQVRFYQDAQFYISIPASDATSVSLLESMAYGCIPLVSNIPANREWILNGVNGLYWPGDSPPQVRDLKRLLTSAQKIADMNRSIITAKGIWKDNFLDFLAALQSLDAPNNVQASPLTSVRENLT